MAAQQYGNLNVADPDSKFALSYGVREKTATLDVEVSSSSAPSLASAWWTLLSSPFSTKHEISGSQAVTSKPANIPTRFPESLVGLLQRVSPSRLGSSVNIQQVVVDYLDAVFDSSPEGEQFLGQIGSLLESTPVLRHHDLAKILSAIAGVSAKMRPGTVFWLDELLKNHEDLQGDEFLPWLTKRMPRQILQSIFGFDLTTLIILSPAKRLKITVGNGSFATEYDSYARRSSPTTSVTVLHANSETASGLPTFGQIESFKKLELEAILGRPPGPIRVPDYFPDDIATMIHTIPLVMEGDKIYDMQRLATNFIYLAFGIDSSDSMALLQQFALFLEQAPLSFSQDVGKLFISIVMGCWKLDAGETISVHKLAQQTDTPLRNGFLQYLSTVPNATLEHVFGLPVTAAYLSHLVAHMEAYSLGPDCGFGLFLTRCETGLHKPQPNSAFVERLVSSLQTVSIDSLAEDDRNCGVCRGGYGEIGNFLNDEPEEPVKLACGHHFGKSCLTVVLSPKPTGWAHTCCPLCRQIIALFPTTPLGNILGLT